MFPVLDKIPAPVFALADWIGRLAVPNLGTLSTLSLPPLYPSVDTVAPSFGYICHPADLETNVALCIDGGMYRQVGLSTLARDVVDLVWPWLICCIVLITAWVTTVLSVNFAKKTYKKITGISRLDNGIAHYSALASKLEEIHTEKVAALMELTVSIGPIEGQLLHEEIEVERLKQVNIDNEAKLQAVEDELRANETQAETLRTEVEDIKELNAQGLAYIAATERTLAEKKASAAATEAALSRELAVLELRLAQNRFAALQNEIASEDAAHEEALAETQRRHCKSAFQHAALVAEKRSAQESHVAEVSTLNAELASLEAKLAALNSELAATAARKKSLAAEHDRLVLEASAYRERFGRELEDAAVAEAAMLMTAHDLRTADREAAVVLEKNISALDQALARATMEYNDLQDSLEFSVVEHRLHMHTCEHQFAEDAQQLATLETLTADEEARLAALNEEVAALEAGIAAERLEFEAELRGLEWRLKMVSEGYAEECAKLAAAQGELQKVQAAHEQERRQHWKDIAAYQAEQRANDALADELLQEIALEQARIDALEAELSGRTALDEAQRKLDAVLADAAEVARERAIRDAQIADASAELTKARRELAEEEAETTRLREAYRRRLEQFDMENRELEGQVAFQSTLQRAECDKLENRVMLLEAAIQLCEFGDGG